MSSLNGMNLQFDESDESVTPSQCPSLSNVLTDECLSSAVIVVKSVLNVPSKMSSATATAN